MGVVVHARLVRRGQQQRVGLGDRLILFRVIDQGAGFSGIASAKDGAGGLVDVADPVAVGPSAAEIGTDLFGLLDVGGLAGFIEFQD